MTDGILKEKIYEMDSAIPEERILRTTIGDFPLDECRLAFSGREWTILHIGAVFSHAEESRYLREQKERLPYGVTLWAAAVALAHDIAARAASFRECRVLELGAGTGLPGIVAAAHGARVLQTDRHQAVIALCRRNVSLNSAGKVKQVLLDWTDWSEVGQYQWIIGSDILYADEMHPHLRNIFETNLAPGGRVLLSDPFRETGYKMLEALESDGWTISMSKWSIGEGSERRPIGVFELAPPTRQRAGAR